MVARALSQPALIQRVLQLFSDRVARGYVLVGLICTVTAYVAIFAALGAGASNFVANAIGFLVGLPLSFILNSRWVFGAKASGQNFTRFLLCFGLAYAINLGVLTLLADVLRWPSGWAQFFAFGTYSVAFYLLNRLWTFKQR